MSVVHTNNNAHKVNKAELETSSPSSIFKIFCEDICDAFEIPISNAKQRISGIGSTSTSASQKMVFINSG